jgi:predicted nuclease of predicted toxin-antitoxin system
MAQAPDIAILERARDEARTIITADLDYPRLLALGASIEPSLILFRGGNWSDVDVLAHMEMLLDTFVDADFHQCVFVVERNRVRRRRLPIGS